MRPWNGTSPYLILFPGPIDDDDHRHDPERPADEQRPVGHEQFRRIAAAGALMDEAKRLSPAGITLRVNTDNERAIRFYARNGFAHAGDDINPTSGRPVLKMEWKP